MFSVFITDDFDPKKIIDSGQCFRALEVSPGLYRFIHRCHAVTLCRGEAENEWLADCTEEEWRNVWHGYFDLDTCYRDIREQAVKTRDPWLAECAAQGRGIRILRQDIWETLVSFIISQRKNIPSIRKAVEYLSGHFGSKIGDVYAFPTAEQMKNADAEALAGARLGYRTPYVLDAVGKVTSGEIKPEELEALSDEELTKALQKIRGVGIKVARCVALFACGRKAVAPVDTWILKAIDGHYNGVNPFERFGASAGVFQQYMFYTLTNHKSGGITMEEPMKIIPEEDLSDVAGGTDADPVIDVKFKTLSGEVDEYMVPPADPFSKLS